MKHLDAIPALLLDFSSKKLLLVSSDLFHFLFSCLLFSGFHSYPQVTDFSSRKYLCRFSSETFCSFSSFSLFQTPSYLNHCRCALFLSAPPPPPVVAVMAKDCTHASWSCSQFGCGAHPGSHCFSYGVQTHLAAIYSETNWMLGITNTLPDTNIKLPGSCSCIKQDQGLYLQLHIYKAGILVMSHLLAHWFLFFMVSLLPR